MSKQYDDTNKPANWEKRMVSFLSNADGVSITVAQDEENNAIKAICELFGLDFDEAKKVLEREFTRHEHELGLTSKKLSDYIMDDLVESTY